MILKPNEIFPIVRQLNDPNDSGTYYVQAKVRNAETDALLATVNLSDKGNQRFTYQYTVPADTSGEGFYIDIETIVYTNSGYTTIAEVYGRENRDYLVQERQVPPFGGGGGDVSYQKIRTVLQEEIKGAKGKDVDLSSIETRLEAIESRLNGIKIPEYKQTDISAVIEAVRGAQREIQGSIKAIPAPKEAEPIDFEPIIKTVRDIGEEVKDKVDEMKNQGDDRGVKSDEEMTGVKNILSSLVKRFNKILVLGMGPMPEAEKIEEEKPKIEEAPKRVRRINLGGGFGAIGLLVFVAISILGVLGLHKLTTSEVAEAQIFGDTQYALPLITATTSPFNAYTVRVSGKNLYFPYSNATTSTLSLLGTNITGSTRCLQITSAGVVEVASAACGSGGGSGGGTWSTTTSQVAGRLVNYPNNDTDIVGIGSSSTTTAEFWFDPNTLRSVIPLASSTAITATNLFSTFFTIGGDAFDELVGTGLQLSSGDLQTTLGTSISASEIADGDHGDFTYASGVATVDANAIALGTDTTGNYAATVSSSGSVTVGNSGSETAAITVDLNMGNANTWTALQTFANASTTLGSFSYASSTVWRGGGLTDCDADSQTVSWDTTTGQFGCGDDDNSGGGGSGNVATSSAETSGHVPYWTSTASTPATLGSDAGLTYSATADRLTMSYASTTAITISGKAYFGTNNSEIEDLSSQLYISGKGGSGILMTASDVTSANAPNVTIIGGNAFTSGRGGDVTIQGGDGDDGAGGDINLNVGLNNNGNIYSDVIQLQGNLGIATSTPQWKIQALDATKSQLTLSSGGSSNHISFRNYGGQFAIATSSPASFATSSKNLISFNSNGQPTLPYLASCNTIDTDSSGVLTCGTDADSGGGGSFPFTATTNYGQVVYATSTPTLWFQSGLFASSTSHFVNASTSLITTGAGSASIPSFSFTADHDTGLFNTANNLAITTGGTQRFDIDSTDLVFTVPMRGGDGSVSAPTYSLSDDSDTGFYSAPAELGIDIAVDGTRVAKIGSGGTSLTWGTGGSSADPEYSWLADTNTGMFQAAADSIGFSTNGIERLRINTGGNVGIATTTPYAPLSVVGVGGIVAEKIHATSTTATSTFAGDLRFDAEIMPDGATCSNGQILKKTGANDWDCAADADSGGATAWNAIGDASANGTVDFGDTTQTITGNTNDVTAIAQDALQIIYTNDAATDILTQQGLFIQNAASANGMEALLVLDNADTDDVVTDGILISTAAGAITTALNVSDPEIVTALSVGANDVTGTSWSITGATGAGVLATLDTGQGANELYDMDQNVLVASSVTFANATSTGNLGFNGEIQPDGALCSNGQILKKTGANDWDCAADDNSGGGGTFSWTPTTNFGQVANATTTQIWFQGSPISLSASSTAVFNNASTSLLTITPLATAAGAFLAVNPAGLVVATTSPDKFIDTLYPEGSMPPTTLYATLDTRPGGSTPAESVLVLDFDDSTIEYTDWKVVMPSTYHGGGLTAILKWSATTAVGTAASSTLWSMGIRNMVENSEDIDASQTYDYNNASATVTGTASGNIVSTTITFTDGADMDSWGAGQEAIIRVRRVATDATDDVVGDAELWSVTLKET